MGLTTLRPCVPFGTISTLNRTSRIITDMGTAPAPEGATPAGGPVGAQAKTTIAATMETMRAGERTSKGYQARGKWEANPHLQRRGLCAITIRRRKRGNAPMRSPAAAIFRPGKTLAQSRSIPRSASATTCSFDT